MDNSPIAGRTRARVNSGHSDTSNQDIMSERDLNHTPDPNGSDFDQENGNPGQPESSPNDFEGFEPGSFEGINASNLFQAFLNNSRNLGNTPEQGNQGFADASHNFGHMPQTHNDQSFTNADRDFGRMPHTQTLLTQHLQTNTILTPQWITWVMSR